MRCAMGSFVLLRFSGLWRLTAKRLKDRLSSTLGQVTTSRTNTLELGVRGLGSIGVRAPFEELKRLLLLNGSTCQLVMHCHATWHSAHRSGWYCFQ